MRRSLALAFALVALSAPDLARADLVDVVPRVKQAVVAIGTWQRTRSPSFQFRGTGFAVGDGRHIVTNAHVLPESLSGENLEALVMVQPGSDAEHIVRPLTRLEVDAAHDLALLRFEAGMPLPALPLGEAAREGQHVAFTGFPLGGVLGIVPATHRGLIAAITPIAMPQRSAAQLDPAQIRSLQRGAFHVYQLDATAYPGNSGGPLFDADTGKVLGIINMVFVKTTKENILSQPSGISYAIPVEYVRRLLEKNGDE
ncbi:MAG: serine protease [Azoarcus sp.]|jgi:S1-C subfamily serine protease|nr:serine protease [Azoarcus sp.]